MRGLPAVMVIASGIVVLTLAQDRKREGDVRRRYLDAVQQAVEVEDWTTVETLGRKLAQLRTADAVGPYFIALAAEGAGQTERARRLMTQIAPRNRSGFAPAHWWLVRTLTTRHTALNNDEVLEVRDHLRHFLKINDQHYQAHALLSQIELSLGNADEAVRLMIAAGDLNPGLKLTAARFASRLGRTTVGRSQAEQASRHYRLRVDENPGDVEARLNWADTLTMLGETEQAAQVLAAGLDVTDDPRLRTGFVRLCNSTFDILQQSGDSTVAGLQKQLSLLKESLGLAPQSTSALKRLAQLSVQDNETGREAARLLEPYLSNGTAPAAVHLVLGADAISRKDYDAAQQHYGRAHQLDPAFPACVNNLAWSLAHGDHPDLPKALSLADRATHEAPDRPEFHETRGQILVKLGRFEEAVPELQQGLHTTGDVTTTHARLAEAYDALGQPTLASYHRQQERTESPTQ